MKIDIVDVGKAIFAVGLIVYGAIKGKGKEDSCDEERLTPYEQNNYEDGEELRRLKRCHFAYSENDYREKIDDYKAKGWIRSAEYMAIQCAEAYPHVRVTEVRQLPKDRLEW